MNQATVRSSMQAVAAIYRRDPKRAGLITAATVAMLGIGARVLFSSPARASAMVVRIDTGSEGFRRPGSSALQNPGLRSALDTGVGVALDPAAWSSWLNAERHAPRRNLFGRAAESGSSEYLRTRRGERGDVDQVIAPASVPTAVMVSQTAPQTKETGGIWDEVAKSMAAQADQNMERQRSHLVFLRRQAGELRLTQYVPGPPPAAWVNGELVGEGSVVASFRVLTIEPRRIIVEREGILLEIPLNQATMPK